MTKSRSPLKASGAKELRQRFIILLPAEMAEQIRTLASEGRRPLNSQFEMLIEEALEARAQVEVAA